MTGGIASTPLEEAGGSALLQAEVFDDYAECLERQIRSLQEILSEHRGASRRYRARGRSGERAIAASVERVLIDFGSAQWHILADRRWPGTRRANLDLRARRPARGTGARLEELEEAANRARAPLEW